MKPNSWSLRLGRDHDLPIGIWSFYKPNKSECASFCGNKNLDPRTRKPEIRDTGFEGALQVWYYCPGCWAAMVELRRKEPTISLKSMLGSVIEEYAWERRP